MQRSTARPARRTERRTPWWPATVGAAKPGSSGAGTSTGSSPSVATASCQPEPRTIAASWWSRPVRLASSSAAARARAKGPSPPGSATGGGLERLGDPPRPFGGLLGGERERRGDAKHVAVEAAFADEHAAPARLLEHARRRRRARGGGARLDQLDAHHQPLAAHLGDDRVVLARPAQVLDQLVADLGGVGLQVVALVVVEGGEGGAGGERVAAEGRDLVALHAVHQLAPGDDAADGEAVTEALGEGHGVRDEAVRLDAPEVLAGAPP